MHHGYVAHASSTATSPRHASTGAPFNARNRRTFRRPLRRGRVLIPAEAVACFIESNLTGPSEVEQPKASRARRNRPAAREPLEPGRRLVDFHSSS